MLKPKNIKLLEESLEVGVLFLFVVFPLILIQADSGSFRIQTICLFAVTMICLFIYCFLIRKKKWVMRKLQYHIDIVVLITALWQLCRMTGKLFQNPDLGAIKFDAELIVISLSVLYLLISSGAVFHRYYFDFILYPGLLVFAALLYRFMCDIEFGGIIGLIAEDTYAISSYTLLVCTISTLLYCRCREKYKSFFYLSTSVIGFFVLFINENLVSICLMAMVFFAIPILFRPTAELVKRDMQVLFAYGFLLSNMGLIANYTSLIGKELHYDISNSIYIDLALAIGGIIFFWYWEKLPEDADRNRLVLRRMRRAYIFVLKAMGILFTGIILVGVRWKQLPEGFGLTSFKGFAIALIEEIKQSKSMLYLSFEYQGLAGALSLIVFGTLIIARLRKNYYIDKPVTGLLLLVADLYLVQLLFWSTSINSLPLYFILLVFAAFYKEKKEKIVSQRINLHQEKGSLL